MHNVQWSYVKRNDLSVDLDDFVRVGRSLSRKLSYDNVKYTEKIDEARTDLGIAISNILSIISDLTESSVEMVAFIRTQENFGRVLNILDEYRNREMSVKAIKDFRPWHKYIGMQQEILYGIIYYSLVDAIKSTKKYFEFNPRIDTVKNKQRFFVLKLYEIISMKVNVFGSVSRKGGKSKEFSIGDSSLHSAEELFQSEETANDFTENFDEVKERDLNVMRDIDEVKFGGKVVASD